MQGQKRALVLDMSVASHCELLDSAVENLKPYLIEFLNEKFSSVVSNVSTEIYNTKDEAVELLASQLIRPVKYKQSIKAHDSKVDLYIEFGQGAVLKGLNRKITDKPTLNVSDMKTLEETIGALNE